MKPTTFFLLFALSLVIVACAPTLRPPSVSPDMLRQETILQREFIYKTIVERKIKLQRIYTPMRLANADVCFPNLSPVTGLTGIDRSTLDAGFREIAQRVHGVSDGVKIIDVVPESPAAKAGLLSGDVITGAANGGGVMPSGWGQSSLTIPSLVKVIEASKGGLMTFLVRRAENTFPLTFAPGLGCQYPIELKVDENLNAFADGSRIVVNTGTFTYIPDDQELAFIIGHELAHNILQHVQKKQGNAAVGAAAGLILDIGLVAAGINTGGLISRASANAGSMVYSREFEAEADYMGLYLLARSGFDINAAPNALRRMGVAQPSSQLQLYSSTHPSTPERAAAMQQTIVEITDKREHGKPLAPKTIAQEKQDLEQKSSPPLVAEAQIGATAVGAPVQTVSRFIPMPPKTPSAIQPPVPSPAPARAAIDSRTLAQLYLIKGPMVTNPPQTFNGEFLPTGKAQVILSSRRLLTGEFELFALGESVKTKFSPRLINPDIVKPIVGADANGFAVLSDGNGSEIECIFSLTRSTGHGGGQCTDNQRNTYRLVFD